MVGQALRINLTIESLNDHVTEVPRGPVADPVIRDPVASGARPTLEDTTGPPQKRGLQKIHWMQEKSTADPSPAVVLADDGIEGAL